MSVAEKLSTIANNVSKVYEKGLEDGVNNYGCIDTDEPGKYTEIVYEPQTNII